MSNMKDEAEELPVVQRPPSPPPFTTFAARGVHVCLHFNLVGSMSNWLIVGHKFRCF